VSRERKNMQICQQIKHFLHTLVAAQAEALPPCLRIDERMSRTLVAITWPRTPLCPATVPSQQRAIEQRDPFGHDIQFFL
jgi:hypothetical protein